MALSVAARRALSHGLKSNAVGDEIADAVDAGTGTISDDARRRMDFATTSRVIGDGICDAVDAGEALTGPEQARLGVVMNSRPLAAEVAAALAAE